MPKPPIVTKSAPVKPPAAVIQRLIYVSGLKPCGYTLRLHGFDGMENLPFNKYSVAHRVCLTMREIAAEHPDWFPPSMVEKAKAGPMYAA
jgi:hypothetical protein